MSYSDTAALLSDASFNARVTACGWEQSQTFVADGRPEFSGLASGILSARVNPAVLVAPTATRPGITAESTDADILSAVQFVWPLVGTAYVDMAPV